MKDFLLSTASTFLSMAYLVGLLLAIGSRNPWIYQPLLAVLLLLPAVFCLVFSFAGRDAHPGGRIERVFNVMGTTGYLVAGLLMLVAYGWLLWSKVRPGQL